MVFVYFLHFCHFDSKYDIFYIMSNSIFRNTEPNRRFIASLSIDNISCICYNKLKEIPHQTRFTMKKTNKIFLVGNSHLDPIWQWRWQEGSAEAKATIRSALDRMKEFPEFIFVCSSASVYKWVEEFAPDMFEEIKERVREGRFVVVGGWNVQPDCNLPTGEGFARQTLYSQRYFKETLGVTAKVGYNVDTFGHNAMIPQILRKSGMDSYVFLRPGPHEKELESYLFKWVSPDGSSVLAHRICGSYGWRFGGYDGLNELIEKNKTEIDSPADAFPFFYGVGNHGGGPTIRNLELLREYAEKHPECELVYSNLSDFFEYVQSSGIEIPELHDDLQHHASGCYSTVSEIKRNIRRAEFNLSAAEIYSVMSNKLLSRPYKADRFEDAWNNICFLHFHDAIDGCSIYEAYEDARYMAGASLNTAAVSENNALQSLSWAVDTSADKDKGLPLFIFNPHSFDIEEVVQINQTGAGITDTDGNDLPSQNVLSTTLECRLRDDIAFKAKVPAMGYAVYYLKEGAAVPNNTESGTVKAVEFTGNRTANCHEGTVLENEFWRIEFELYSGYIISFKNKLTGEEIINGRSAVPVVIDEYYHDTWSHAKNFFTDEMARFSDAEVTVTENGPVRATVKVVSRYNSSTLTQYFTLYSGSDKLSVSARLDWHEKHKMLKIKWDMKVDEPKAVYEIPFGMIERPADGEEEPGLCWFGVKSSSGGYAVVNNDTYSSSVNGGVMYHTVVRSPIYGDHGGPRTDESRFTDQGEREFRYILMPLGNDVTPVIRTARQLNKPTTNIIENWHTGRLTDKVWRGIEISVDNVMVSALKRAEDGKGLVIRVYETEGRETQFRISGALIEAPLEETIGAYSFETYYLADTSDTWKKVLLTEYEE